MVKFRSEDIVIFNGLTSENTELTVFFEALETFFKKKLSIDSSDRFNFILFEERKPNFLEDFTNDYERLLSALKSLKAINIKVDIASALFGAVPLFIDEYKKMGDKSFRLIMFVDSGTPKVSDFHIPIIEDLIDKIKEQMMFFIDIVGINTEDPLEEAKITKLANKTKGDFYKIKDIYHLAENLILLSEKKEIKSIGTLDKDGSSSDELNSFYEYFAQDPIPIDVVKTCSVCFIKDKEQLVKCPICGTIAHKSCWANWAKTSHIGIPHLFRCHNCYNLMKLDREFVLKVQLGMSTEEAQKEESKDVINEEIDPRWELKREEPEKLIKISEKQVQATVEQYIIDKSKTNKKITSSMTIKAINKILQVAEGDNSWDEIIWAFAKVLSKDYCIRRTAKTIVFSD